MSPQHGLIKRIHVGSILIPPFTWAAKANESPLKKWALLLRRKKAPKGKSETPWSHHIRSFWIIRFIDPPEVHGQVVKLQIHRRVNDDAKVSKSPI
jgi:hypothetical protein